MLECLHIKMLLLGIEMVAICLILKQLTKPQFVKQEAELIVVVNFLLREGIGSLRPNPERKQTNMEPIGLIGLLVVPCVCFVALMS